MLPAFQPGGIVLPRRAILPEGATVDSLFIREIVDAGWTLYGFGDLTGAATLAPQWAGLLRLLRRLEPLPPWGCLVGPGELRTWLAAPADDSNVLVIDDATFLVSSREPPDVYRTVHRLQPLLATLVAPSDPLA